MHAVARRACTIRFRCLLSILLAAGGTASADPPGTVARMSDAIGDIGYSRVDDDRWMGLERNRPLVEGDRLWTGPRSRLELQVGSAAVRLAADTSLEIVALDDRVVQLRVTQGSLNLRVPRLYEGQQFEIATPTLALVVERPGRFRIDVAPNAPRTTVIVWAGEATAYDERSRRDLRRGDHVAFRGRTLDDHRTAALPAPDGFDRYCIDRDRRLDDSASLRYVGADLAGHADLDDYGNWRSIDDYGAVWFPRGVRADWAPFRDGHWTWQAPWGWTWIDDAPWGFAPSHYGRWLQVSGRWGWLPGPRDARPYYAPAVVAFIGGGGARVGWFPLGPREPYLPPYRVERDYFERVNRYNRGVDRASIDASYQRYSRADARDDSVAYRNRRVAGAVSAMDGPAFAGSRPVRGSAVVLDRAAIERGALSRGAPVEPPARGAASAGPEARTRPARGVFDRSVVVRNASAQGDPADRRTTTDPGTRSGRDDVPDGRLRGGDTPRSADRPSMPGDRRDRMPAARDDPRRPTPRPAEGPQAPTDRRPQESLPQGDRARDRDPENTDADGRRLRSRLPQPVPASDLPGREPSRRGVVGAPPTGQTLPDDGAPTTPPAPAPPSQDATGAASSTGGAAADRERRRDGTRQRLRPPGGGADPAVPEEEPPGEAKPDDD